MLYFIQHPRVSLDINFREKVKMSKFLAKSVLFGYFEFELFKNDCHILNNQYHQICLTANFFKKYQKIQNLGTKMPYFGISQLELLKAISYLKSAPSNFSRSKFREKKSKNCLNLGQKNAWFGYFSARIFKNHFIFEVSTLKFIYIKISQKKKKKKGLNFGQKIPD